MMKTAREQYEDAVTLKQGLISYLPLFAIPINDKFSSAARNGKMIASH